MIHPLDSDVSGHGFKLAAVRNQRLHGWRILLPFGLRWWEHHPPPSSTGLIEEGSESVIFYNTIFNVVRRLVSWSSTVRFFPKLWSNLKLMGVGLYCDFFLGPNFFRRKYIVFFEVLKENQLKVDSTELKVNWFQLKSLSRSSSDMVPETHFFWGPYTSQHPTLVITHPFLRLEYPFARQTK